MNRNLVNAVKQHALDHYNDGGWDVIVECWEDEEIWAWLAEGESLPGTEAEAIAAFEPLVAAWRDRQADARNSAF